MKLFRLAALAAFPLCLCAQTTVTGPITDATGATWSGKVHIAPIAVTASGVNVGPLIKTVTVTAGVFSQALYAGTYSVTYISATSRWSRTWTVPAVGPVLINTIESGATATPLSTFTYSLVSGLTLGDLLYGASTGVAARLAGNVTAARKYLCQTGTGTVSAAPAWCTGTTGTVVVKGSTGSDCNLVFAGGALTSTTCP